MTSPSKPDGQHTFIAALDSAESYMAAQQELGEALRAGFLSLAQARYSMGADRVSPLQYPSHMAASARVRVAAEDGQLELVEVEVAAAAAAAGGATVDGLPTSSSSTRSSSNHKVAAATIEAAAAAAEAQPPADPAASASTSADPPAAPAAALDTLDMEQQLRRMRLVAQQSDGLLAQLAAKYCTADPEAQPSSCSQAADPSGDSAGGSALAPRPHRPLHWFGSLPPPSLRDAEGHFRQALALAVLAANARRALQRGINDAAAAAASQAAGAPVP